MRIHEPAADLAAAAALVSSLANAPLPADAVYFGEVSLSGAVRPVAQARPGSKKPPSSALPAPSCRKRREAEAGDPGLKAYDVGNLDRSGRRHRRPGQTRQACAKPVDKTGDGAVTPRYIRGVKTGSGCFCGAVP